MNAITPEICTDVVQDTKRMYVCFRCSRVKPEAKVSKPPVCCATLLSFYDVRQVIWTRSGKLVKIISRTEAANRLTCEPVEDRNRFSIFLSRLFGGN